MVEFTFSILEKSAIILELAWFLPIFLLLNQIQLQIFTPVSQSIGFFKEQFLQLVKRNIGKNLRVDAITETVRKRLSQSVFQ